MPLFRALLVQITGMYIDGVFSDEINYYLLGLRNSQAVDNTRVPTQRLRRKYNLKLEACVLNYGWHSWSAMDRFT